MTEGRTTVKKRKLTERWWWPTAVVVAALGGLYLAGETGLLDLVGDAIEWARRTNCEFFELEGCV